MLDHMTLTVRDMARSKPFYTALLAPLGYRVLMEFEGMCGFGDDKPYLWMKQGEPPTAPQHIAFAARRRADVDAFHAAGLAAGGQDNGPAGPRPDYHPSYYAAFVLDPDGHNLEAVNHREGGGGARKAKPKAAARRSAKAKGGKARRAPAKKAKRGARRAR
jgi:catechol 2,3-dioxygenase-like lactoylglutathione lyase family enzyme